MKTYRKTGVVIGLFFLIATITFMAGHTLILGALDGFAGVATEANALTAGALLLFVDALAVAGIAFLIFPLLKRYSEPAALAYAGLRVGEFAAVLLLMASPLLVVPLAVAAPAAGLDASASAHLSGIARAQYDAAMALVFLCTGASGTVLAFVLVRSRLVPLPLAVLGAVGYPAMLAGTALDMLKLLDLQQGAGLLLVWPVGLFELALPVWLFIKGFNTEKPAAP
ncbi:MAG TPA: DUF4386 domain-containing protein [Gammaproteobacteria bacterium]